MIPLKLHRRECARAGRFRLIGIPSRVKVLRPALARTLINLEVRRLRVEASDDSELDCAPSSGASEDSDREEAYAESCTALTMAFALRRFLLGLEHHAL